jgi:hypothetical protein
MIPRNLAVRCLVSVILGLTVHAPTAFADEQPTSTADTQPTSNCAYRGSEPGSTTQCEAVVEQWRAFQAKQDEHILDDTFTLPEVFEQFFSADVDQLSLSDGSTPPVLLQGRDAVRLAAQQMGQLTIQEVVPHFVHVHVIDEHTVAEAFDSTLVTAAPTSFNLRIAGSLVGRRQGAQESWLEELLVIQVLMVPKE